jgi:hypothetical protein
LLNGPLLRRGASRNRNGEPNMTDSHATKRRISALCAIASCVALTLSACSAEPTGDSATTDTERSSDVDPSMIEMENEAYLNPIARVNFPGQGSVRFYEPEPGYVVVLQSGVDSLGAKIGAKAAGATLVEKYERLAGAAAPQTLRDAVARADRLAAEAPPSIAGERGGAPQLPEQVPGPLLREKNHTGDWFWDGYCDMHLQWNADEEAFWPWVTGTGSFTWTTLDVVQSAARSNQGQVRFRVRWRPRASWSGYTTLYLNPGEHAIYYEEYRDLLRFGWNSIVDQASDPGDIYDFCSWGNH